MLKEQDEFASVKTAENPRDPWLYVVIIYVAVVEKICFHFANFRIQDRSFWVLSSFQVLSWLWLASLTMCGPSTCTFGFNQYLWRLEWLISGWSAAPPSKAVNLHDSSMQTKLCFQDLLPLSAQLFVIEKCFIRSQVLGK